MKSRMLLILLLVLAVPALAQDGAATFGSKCVPCHGKDGSGNTPMGKRLGAKALGSADVQKLSDAQLIKDITGGNGKMPAFGKQLSPEQIGEVVKLVRSFAAK